MSGNPLLRFMRDGEQSFEVVQTKDVSYLLKTIPGLQWEERVVTLDFHIVMFVRKVSTS
jgi:hypothetical protein